MATIERYCKGLIFHVTVIGDRMWRRRDKNNYDGADARGMKGWSTNHRRPSPGTCFNQRTSWASGSVLGGHRSPSESGRWGGTRRTWSTRINPKLLLLTPGSTSFVTVSLWQLPRQSVIQSNCTWVYCLNDLSLPKTIA